MDFTKRRSLFKRPGGSGHDDCYGDDDAAVSGSRATKTVKSKPIAKKFAEKLGSDHQPRNFVNASAASAAEFYSNNQVMEIEEERKRKEAEDAESASQLTADEKNKLSAKILKAEMMGNIELANKLKRQLEAGVSETRVFGEETHEGSGKEEKDILLMKTDFRTGLTVPYKKKPRTDLRAESSSKEASVRNIGELLEEEKMTSVDDNLAMIGDMASKSGASQRIDSEWTVDDVLLAKKKKRKHIEKEEERQRSRAIADHRRFEETLDSCPYCIESKKLRKHLIVATGLKIWRKGLVAMFREREEDCVFLETAKNVEHQPHMRIECVPLPLEVGDTAPIYFKKAILECEKEWSQNKKLIELGGKDIRRSVPKGFSYFSVDFGLQGGFAHVIEDEKLFPSYFGQEIIGGMLDLEHNLWRKPGKQTFEEQTEKVKRMKELWQPFDWTERAKRAIQT